MAQHIWKVSFFREQASKHTQILVNRKQTRRSKNRNRNKSLNIIGINCNGLSGKRESLAANLDILRPSVFFIQETKFMKKGLFQHKNYDIFEYIRTTGGGSILTGVENSLNPILISDGSDEIEILVVEGEIGNRKCRFINGYGPQECADINKRIQFFAKLEEEVIKAVLHGCSHGISGRRDPGACW